MSIISEILEFNRKFVENKQYEQYMTTKFPDKKLVIVTCMDTRLVELLPKAMNLKNGDVKIVKNAGAIVTMPFGNIMRSIIVALYQLNAKEVVVIGHHECGMTGLNADEIIAKMRASGIKEEVFRTLAHSGIDLHRWLTGFDNVRESVEKSVGIIKNHPLLPPGIAVHGMIIHPQTGALELVVDGYEKV
jgi:carbonic anhydrase